MLSPFRCRLEGTVEIMPDPEDEKDVQAVIGLYEDADEDGNNALVDHETGLNSATVDEVLDNPWKLDQVEGIVAAGDRPPSLVGILRVLPGRDQLWGTRVDSGLIRKPCLPVRPA